MNLDFTPESWDEYLDWLVRDRKTTIKNQSGDNPFSLREKVPPKGADEGTAEAGKLFSDRQQ